MLLQTRAKNFFWGYVDRAALVDVEGDGVLNGHCFRYDFCSTGGDYVDVANKSANDGCEDWWHSILTTISFTIEQNGSSSSNNKNGHNNYWCEQPQLQ